MQQILERRYFAVAVILKSIRENDPQVAQQRLEAIFDCYRSFPEEEQPGWYAQLGRELNVLLYYQTQEHKVNFLQAWEHYVQMEARLAGCRETGHWQQLLPELLQSYCRLIHAHSRQHYSNLIRACLDHIDQNYKKPLTVEGEAKRLNVSRSYLSHRFVQEMGCSFTDYVNRTRIGYACELLAKLQFPIQQVADVTGFSSSNYFARIFRKQMGMTPTQYRSRMQKGNG